MSNIFKPRTAYKPFEYSWMYDAYKAQNEVHWMANEVSFREDLDDWNTKLTKDEVSFLTNIFRFFTQADIDVGKAYYEKYLPMFPKPEAQMMLSAFAGMEAIHVDAYATLIESLGLPESEYNKFQEYEEMAAKHDYLWEKRDLGDPIKNTMLDIAKFSAFTEGLQLYSSFAMLMWFQKRGLMKSMGNIVAWSVRDESMHVGAMIKVLEEIKAENPGKWDARVQNEVHDMAAKMVALELNFVDLCYTDDEGNEVTIEGLEKADIKNFVRYTANRRLNQLGLAPLYSVDKNPCLWFDMIINGLEHANFFELRATEYQKAATQMDEEATEW